MLQWAFNLKWQMIRCNGNSEQPLLQLRIQNALQNILAILIGFQYFQIYPKEGKIFLYNCFNIFNMLNETTFQLFYLLFHLLVFLIPKHFVNFLKRAVYSVKRLNVNLPKSWNQEDVIFASACSTRLLKEIMEKVRIILRDYLFFITLKM